MDAGSSPLARGTPNLEVAEVACGGLIPARAGNTSREAKRHPGARAHPRSRGEHCGSWCFRLSVRGSSPLARGTPQLRYTSQGTPGLIPARAGNTASVCRGWRVMGAHPRSRGEHHSAMIARCTCLGSSPLARGTPSLSRSGTRSCGLIPARAGNTLGSQLRASGQGAHPRSRGEHAVIALFVLALAGSSPLARGTRRVRLQSYRR